MPKDRIIKVYEFNELSDKAKDHAISELDDINVKFDWWDTTYDDATEIGLQIQGFDIDAKNIKGKFTLNADEVAKLIIENHGENCDTYKTAAKYLTELTTLKNINSVSLMDGEETDTTEIDNEFLNDLLKNYLTMLKEEYEYQTSEESIIESIEANNYEFDIDGNRI